MDNKFFFKKKQDFFIHIKAIESIQDTSTLKKNIRFSKKIKQTSLYTQLKAQINKLKIEYSNKKIYMNICTVKKFIRYILK